jgi:hypothetical protein
MNKQELYELIEAVNLIDKLQLQYGTNEALPERFRNALNNADSECGMLRMALENEPRESLLTVNFWHGTLAEDIANGKYHKEHKYGFVTETGAQNGGDYSLLGRKLENIITMRPNRK